MEQVLFLCPHGAAKSVIAQAFFNQFAEQNQLPFRADCAGTEPDDVVSPKAVALLAEQGIDVAQHVPRQVTAHELATANYIVSLGCNLLELSPTSAKIQQWDTIPPVSQEPNQALEAIRQHVTQLIAELNASR